MHSGDIRSEIAVLCQLSAQLSLSHLRPGSPQEGREDGLVVNVSSPHLSPVRRLPVMVWIHGGGFVAGSGSRQMYGMEHFMDRDVVMVSFNYRLGLLGGLYLDRERVPGNQGLRDQVRALQWVRENIEHFGGDKERVTIFGESAGGMSVMNLVLSPAAKVRGEMVGASTLLTVCSGSLLSRHHHERLPLLSLRWTGQTSPPLLERPHTEAGG